MARLLRTYRGKCGVIRWYQHPRWGEVEVATVHGPEGEADVVRICRRDWVDRIRRLWRFPAFRREAQRELRDQPRKLG